MVGVGAKAYVYMEDDNNSAAAATSSFRPASRSSIHTGTYLLANALEGKHDSSGATTATPT
jgi:hypothetical protein